MKKSIILFILSSILVILILVPAIAEMNYDKEVIEKTINYAINQYREEFKEGDSRLRVTHIYLESSSKTAGTISIFNIIDMSVGNEAMTIPCCATVSFSLQNRTISIDPTFTFQIEEKNNSGKGILLNKLTEEECQQIAVKYLRGLSWKNPSSLTINEISALSYSTKSITFSIDYSAQNGLGGYNRENYYIEVDFNTGNILFSYSI